MTPFESSLYGVTIDSDWPLPTGAQEAGPIRIAIRRSADRLEEPASSTTITEIPDWFRCSTAVDGSVYLKWRALLSAHVSPDGTEIAVDAAARVGEAALQSYLLGPVLSFALVRQGIEPLHASAVLTRTGAIALIGDSGAGKSTITARLLRAGASLVTDDLLTFDERAAELRVNPGPPFIKLYPAAALAAGFVDGEAMNRGTAKRIFAVRSTVAGPVPLRAVYRLEARSKGGTEIRRMTATEALRSLLQSTFNPFGAGVTRARHHFELISRLVDRVPVYNLCYRRGTARVDDVVEALLA